MMSKETKKTNQVGEFGRIATFLIGYAVSRAIFAAAYYLIVTPIGLIAKATGKEFMTRKPDPTQTSYWNERARKPTPAARYEKQF